MDPPEDRCGFVLEPERLVERGMVPADARWLLEMPEEEWYRGFGLSSCWREVWGDTGRCIWHAEVTGKSRAAFEASRTGHPESLDGALLGSDAVDEPLEDTISFRDCRLVGADLSDIDLAGATLTGAYLRFADLSGARLGGANLSRTNVGDANLSGTDLRGVELWEAYLSNADLSGADLRDTDFSGVDLERARLHGVDLKSTDLSGAKLVGADFSGANLRDADLSGRDLERIRFVGARLEKADLSGARLRSADLSGRARLQRTDLSGADLWNAALPRAELWRADLSGANLEKANLEEANLPEADLSAAVLERTDLLGANLESVDLSGATLEETDLGRANLEYADLSGATFVRADLSAANFTKAVVSEETVFHELANAEGALFDCVDFRGASLRHVDFGGGLFCRADFTDADLFNADLSGADLSGAVLDGANCRFARFDRSNLGGASAVEADLRSAGLDGANVYGATLTGSRLDPETTITAVYTYPVGVERDGTVPFPQVCSTPSLRGRAPEESGGREDDGWDGQADEDSTDGTLTATERYERAAWTHEAIHRQLIRSGRVREAIHEKHYLQEQAARIGKARLERRYVDLLNLLVTRWLIRVSESPVTLVSVGLATSLGFTVAYALGGGVVNTKTSVRLLSDGLTLGEGVSLFLFSLFTFLGGAYTVVAASLGSFISFDVLVPVGVLLEQVSGVSDLDATGTASAIESVETATGALLLVPFTLLLIQRLALYVGTGVNEEGIGGGLLSWLFGK